jgi:hypothetical protein
MIKGLAITPPVLGRISIGRVVEKNGKRLPEKDDQFTITTQIQTKDGWLKHPLDEELRKESENGKLRTIPVRMLFNDPDLNFRAEYSLFDRRTGRPQCVGDGETCRRVNGEGVETLPCPGPDTCELGKGGLCKPYGRLNVRIGDEDELGTFIFRTTGINSIRTLTARLRYYHALSQGHLATLPLCLRLRGKSTTQSHRAPIYYVDLTSPEDVTLASAIEQAKSHARKREDHGIDQESLDEAARAGFDAAPFEMPEEEGLQVIEEFIPISEEASQAVFSSKASPKRSLSENLAERATNQRSP